MTIDRVRPRAAVTINGQSRTILSGNYREGIDSDFSTATFLLDLSEGKPQPGDVLRVYAGDDSRMDLIGTCEIDVGGVILNPNDLEVQATHVLARTQESIGTPPTIVDGEAEQEYVLTWEGVTAGVIIDDVLDEYGVPHGEIPDSGKTWGNVLPLGLLASDSGWALIKQLDDDEGWQTLGTPDGGVTRVEFTGIPGTVYKTFTQGEDLFAGRVDESRVNTRNRVICSGLPDQTGSTGVDFTPTTVLDAPSPWVPSPPTYRPYTHASPYLETEDDTAAVAARKLGELNRLRGSMPFELLGGDASLRAGMSIAIDAIRLDVRTNVRFRITQLVHNFDGGFQTTGTLLLASEGTGWSANQAPIAIIDAQAKQETLADGTEIVVVALDGSASYDPELGVLGIVSYSWAGDPVDPTAFDSAMRATAIYEDGIPDGAYITLTVTDDLGKTGTTKFYPVAQGLPVKQRDLISAELTRTQTTRDGGATWNTVSPNVAGIGVTEFAAAEYALVWDADGDLHKVLADDTSVGVLAGENITAASISLENGDPEKKTGRTWAGDATGRIWRSYADGDADTWEIAGALPNGQAVTYIGESPFQEGDLEAAAGNAAYRSFDAGATWVEEFAHPNTALIAARIASGFGKGWIGYSGTGDDLGESRLQERDDAVELDADEPDKPINVVGLTLDPFEDVLYVLDDIGSADARLFVGDSANGGNLAEAADWDIIWSRPRHMIRDGTSAGYLYIVANAYLLKSVDGLGTVLELKQITGGGAAGRMLGYGAERISALNVTVVSTGGADKMIGLWNGSGNDAPPPGWYAAEYVDTTWGLAVTKTGQTGTPLAGTDAVWWDAGEVGDEQALLRRTFAVPHGTVNSCQIQVKVDNFVLAVRLNGVPLEGISDEAPFPTFTYDGRAALLPGKTNVLAIWAENGPATMSGAQDWVSYRVEVR